jgi:hypothetical protein
MAFVPSRAASRITLAPGEAVREADERPSRRDRPARTERSAFDADADRLNVVALALASIGALGFSSGSRDPGCGGADSPSSGPNAPCTRTKDCGGDLVCTEGVCTQADSGAGNAVPDSGGRDATSSADAADDGG